MIFDKQTEEEILNELTMLRNNLNVFRESEVKVRLTIIMELVEKLKKDYESELWKAGK